MSQYMSAPCGGPLHAGGPGKPTLRTRCCPAIRKTVAPLSAFVTVTVMVEAGGVINRSGGAVADGTVTAPQAGIDTGGALCVGLGVGGRVISGAGAHPASSVTTARPKRVSRSVPVIAVHDRNAPGS